MKRKNTITLKGENGLKQIDPDYAREYKGQERKDFEITATIEKRKGTPVSVSVDHPQYAGRFAEQLVSASYPGYRAKDAWETLDGESVTTSVIIA